MNVDSNANYEFQYRENRAAEDVNKGFSFMKSGGKKNRVYLVQKELENQDPTYLAKFAVAAEKMTFEPGEKEKLGLIDRKFHILVKDSSGTVYKINKASLIKRTGMTAEQIEAIQNQKDGTIIDKNKFVNDLNENVKNKLNENDKNTTQRDAQEIIKTLQIKELFDKPERTDVDSKQIENIFKKKIPKYLLADVIVELFKQEFKNPEESRYDVIERFVDKLSDAGKGTLDLVQFALDLSNSMENAFLVTKIFANYKMPKVPSERKSEDYNTIEASDAVSANKLLGEMYMNGTRGVTKNPAKANKYFEKAADCSNDGQFIFECAELLNRDRETEFPLQENVTKLYMKAVHRGHPGALLMIGRSYEYKAEEYKKQNLDPSFKYQSAFEYFKKVADSKDGDARAQLKVGDMYEKGLGVQQDITLAKNYYKKASENSVDSTSLANKVAKKNALGKLQQLENKA